MNSRGHGFQRSHVSRVGNGTPYKVRRLLDAEPVARDSADGAGRIVGVAGRVHLQDVIQIFNVSSLHSMHTQLDTMYPTDQAINAITRLYDYHFCVEGINFEITFRNAGTSPCRLFLYDCLFHGKQPTYKDSSSTVLTPHPQYTAVWGWQEQNNSNAAVASDYCIALHPAMSPVFRQFWTVVGRREVYLEPGELHVHTLRWFPHKYISEREFNQYLVDATNWIYIPGVSMVLHTQVMGVPVAADLAGSNNVTTSAPLVHFTYRYDSMYRGAPLPMGNLKNITPGLSTTVRAGNGEINPDTGALQTPAQVPG